jgi:hypothetical protein
MKEHIFPSMQGQKLIQEQTQPACAGSTMRFECDYEQTVSVSGFHDGLDVTTKIPIGTSVTAHDHPKQGTLILAFPQSLYCEESMEDSLINPISREQTR